MRSTWFWPGNNRVIQGLIFCLLCFTPVRTAGAQDIIGIGLGISGGKSASTESPGAVDQALVPVCIVGDAVSAPFVSAPTAYDVAIVCPAGEPQGRSRGVILEMAAYLAHHGVRVAPAPIVADAVRRLGLLTTRALCAPEYHQLGEIIRSRYLMLVTVRQMKASRGLSLGSSLLALGRIAIFGAFLHGRGGGPVLAGVAVAALLVGGITTSATCDVAAQLFDVHEGKTLWIDNQATTRKKSLLGITGDKVLLSAQARQTTIEKLMAVPLGLLAPGHLPVVPARHHRRG